MIDFEEAKKSYPEYTVYICRNTECEIVNIQPYDVYENFGRTYEECKEKLINSQKVEGVFYWEEKQDKDLYEIACLLRKAKIPKKNRSDVLDSIQHVISEIENIYEELDLDEE